jgi:hypothetical protein
MTLSDLLWLLGDLFHDRRSTMPLLLSRHLMANTMGD